MPNHFCSLVLWSLENLKTWKLDDLKRDMMYSFSAKYLTLFGNLLHFQSLVTQILNSHKLFQPVLEWQQILVKQYILHLYIRENLKHVRFLK